MSKKLLNKGSLLIFLILLAYLLWFVFKPYDYTVKFKLKTLPGTINQTIKVWNNLLDKSEITEQTSLNELKQRITFQDSTYLYNWSIYSINDSLSQVNIGIKDLDNSLKNRLTNLFTYSDFEKRVKTEVKDFIDLVDEHLKKIKITIVGEEDIPAMFCAYVPVKAKQFKKAQGMMQNYGLLNSVLLSNNIELKGRPFVEITYWDIKTDSIHFNFCYPIVKKDTLIEHPLIKFKAFKRTKAIKAIYNGNYITSDRAWYALMNYAEKKEIKIINKPVEVFHNNPNMGGNELNWKAEIYMPIQE